MKPIIEHKEYEAAVAACDEVRAHMDSLRSEIERQMTRGEEDPITRAERLLKGEDISRDKDRSRLHEEITVLEKLHAKRDEERREVQHKLSQAGYTREIKPRLNQVLQSYYEHLEGIVSALNGMDSLKKEMAGAGYIPAMPDVWRIVNPRRCGDFTNLAVRRDWLNRTRQQGFTIKEVK